MTHPRTCEGCGLKPVATKTGRFCYDCSPGGPVTPPPCRRCGSTSDYFSAGLCNVCHPASTVAWSCPDCHAWGLLRRRGGLCNACRSWRKRRPTIATCAVCGNTQHLDVPASLCRLCWRQTESQRQPHQRADSLAANRHGQQLFFADMHGRTRRTAAPIAAEPQPPPADGIDQPSLFDSRPHPAAAGLAQLALDHARRHGWSRTHTQRLTRAMRIVIANHPHLGDEPASATTITELLTPLKLPVRHTLALLDDEGLLRDDRTSALDAWFDRHVQDLPDTMAGELRIWFEILRDGSNTPPRSRPRSPLTIRIRLRRALPALRTWANAGHQTLREISRDDVIEILPASGTPRAKMGWALRSIFKTLKAHKVVFVNPTARLDLGQFERNTPLPADPGTIRAALESPEPARAALVALIVFHGLTPAELRGLQLTDIRDRRLWLTERSLPLAEEVATRLAAYLDYRNQRWPNTANPHLFLNSRSAIATGPVGHHWLWRTVGTSPWKLRQDRILDEAHATGGDVRRIRDLFGVTIDTALRYTATLGHPALNQTT